MCLVDLDISGEFGLGKEGGRDGSWFGSVVD